MYPRFCGLLKNIQLTFREGIYEDRYSIGVTGRKHLKRTTPRNMATAGRTSGLVIQALRHLGRAHVSSERIAHLRQLLTDKDRKELLADFRLAPAWMHPFLRAISGNERQA
jgi:hypothetical protein